VRIASRAPIQRTSIRAWLVCLGCGLALFTVMGLGVNAFTVYQPHLLHIHGFTNAQGSWITTVRSLFALLSMLTVDRLCRRLGLRNTMLLGMGCFVISYLLFGFAHSFPAYCGGAVLSGLAYGYGGMIPLTLVISRWFATGRGFALGMAAAGSGISTIFAPPLITRAIQTMGLPAAFLWEAASGVLLTLLVFLLVRDSPDCPESQNTAAPVSGIQGTRLGHPFLWMMLLAAFLTGGPCGPGFSHLTVLYTSAGFSSGTAALLMSYLGLVLIVAKVLYGWLSDRLGSRMANNLIFGVFLAGFALCCLAPTQSLPLAAAAITLTGLGMPLSSVTLSVWAGDLSASEDYDRLVKWLSSAYMLGSLVTGPVPGLLADRFGGSYVPAYVLFLLFLLVSMLLIQTVYRQANVGGRPQN
jgi:predicted MFS family arabinose efflux permease